MRRARELKNNRRSNVLTDKRFSFSRASRLRIYRIHRLIQYFSIAFCPTQNDLPWFSRNRCGGSLCSKFPCCRGICFQVFRSTAIVLNIVKYLFCKWKDSNREWYEIPRVEIRQSTSFLSCASFLFRYPFEKSNENVKVDTTFRRILLKASRVLCVPKKAVRGKHLYPTE